MGAANANKLNLGYFVVDVVVGVFEVALLNDYCFFELRLLFSSRCYAFHVEERFSAISYDGSAEGFEFVKFSCF